MYAIRGWNDFQHYGKRNPPWIKLHKRLLDDFEFHSLPLASRALAPMLWLLASEHKNPKSGFIEGPESKLAFRLRMTVDQFKDAINPLIDNGFIILASTPIAECKQDATPETETRDQRQRKNQRPEMNGHGSLEKIKFMDGEVAREFVPSLATADQLLSIAPGWDHHFLIEKYRKWRRGQPMANAPQAAFLGWAKKFTANRMPQR